MKRYLLAAGEETGTSVSSMTVLVIVMDVVNGVPDLVPVETETINEVVVNKDWVDEMPTEESVGRAVSRTA
jgi:hypothetical protein